MADTYHEYDYLPEEKQRRRALKKRRRWPFVLLGFFIGFITLPALIALTVLLIVNRPVEKTVNTIDKVTNAGLYETLFGDDEKAGILNESYGDMSLSEAFKDIKSIAGKGSSLTFEDLAAISPKVEESIDKLIETAKEKSIILEKTEVMTTPLNQFSELLMDEVQEIEIGEVLLSVKSEIFDDPDTGAILKNLFFGKEGVNYETVDGKPVMLPVSYVYDGENDTFVCVDETSYTKNGDVWTTENSTNYIGRNGEVLALYSADGGVVYQLRADAASAPASKYTAVIVNAEGLIETVKQSSLTLGAFMGEDSNFMDVLGKLELGTLLGIRTKADVEANDPLLITIAYGTYGVDFEYDGDGDDSKIIAKAGGKPFTTVAMLMDSAQTEEIFKAIPLSSIFNVDIFDENADPLIISLVYGTEGTHYVIRTDGSGQKYIEWQIKDAGTGETYRERTFGDLRNGDMADIVKDLKLSSLFTVADGDTGLLATLVHKTDSEGNPWTLAHLTTDNINALTIGEVLGAEVESNFYLKHLQTSTLGSLSTDIQNLTVVQLFADSVYDESHNVKGTWKYLLTDPTGTIAPEEYKVTDMSALMNNMTANIQTATLRELKNDGLASNVSDTTLNAQLVCRILTVSYLDDLKTVLGDDTLTDADDNGYIDGMTMGDLTMLQLSDYLAWFLGKIGA